MTTRVTFNEVTLHGQKSVKCAGGCGRTLKRSKKFWQTLSPFSKTANGELKSRDQIHVELRAERDAWLAQGETCIHCDN